jgi:hypothetical protein
MMHHLLLNGGLLLKFNGKRNLHSALPSQPDEIARAFTQQLFSKNHARLPGRFQPPLANRY